MKTPSEGPSGFGNEQANLGGADAVEKTSSADGHDSPERAAGNDDPGTAAPVRTSVTLGAGTWILLALALGVALYFGGALFG